MCFSQQSFNWESGSTTSSKPADRLTIDAFKLRLLAYSFSARFSLRPLHFQLLFYCYHRDVNFINKPIVYTIYFMPRTVDCNVATLKSTKCSISFLRYLYYDITLNIPTRFDPRHIIIRESNQSNRS